MAYGRETCLRRLGTELSARWRYKRQPRGLRLARARWGCGFPVAGAVEPAVGPLAAAEIGAAGEALAADGHDVRAAGMEAAASGRRDEAGNLAARGQLRQAAVPPHLLW